MPHPPLYSGSQDDDRTRSIDVVHIEPSIREGVHLVSSLYGPEASFPLYRFPPVSSNNAWIRGEAVIPSLLTAEEGTWNASPSAYFEYQWMADGVDIPFATQKTWMSTSDYDGQFITVEIRGINFLGQDITISSSKEISILEPIIVNEQENFLLTGMAQGQIAQTVFIDTAMITSGVGALDRVDVNRSVAYYLTGSAALNRTDINEQRMPVITGIGASGRMDVLERDLGVMVINQQYADPLVTGVPVALPLKNPNAELGLFGWTNYGGVQYDWIPIRSGEWAWHGGDNIGPSGQNIPYTYIWQDIEMQPIWFIDIDAGNTNLDMSWYQYSLNRLDMANIRVEFLDATKNIIGLNDGAGLWASPTNIFFLRNFDIPIPAGTRFIRTYVEFNYQSNDNNNNAGVDDIFAFIRKGNKVTTRDYGPAFEQWRVRFTKANTWSGAGLSELEFRATSGGADLATGGVPIFGSTGLGVFNADFAFDDLRNTGYWAGEENGITTGTAWVGYNMSTPVFPRAIDITARTGSNSLQVGREFLIEGSNDGLLWTPVHFVREDRLGTFESGQQKEVKNPFGFYDFFHTYPETAGYSYTRDQFSGDDFSGKGNIYISNSRFDIENLGVLIEDQAIPFNYRLQLGRANLQKNNTFTPGMVIEVLEDFLLTSPGLNSGLIWQSVACTQPRAMELNDLFIVRFYDVDAATNPVDANEGRTRLVNTNNNPLPHILRDGIAQHYSSWQGHGEAMEIGQVNAGGLGAIDNYWAVDFSGTVF